MKAIRDFFTEADGSSYELIAALGALAVVIALALQVYVTAKTGAFDIITFGTGIGALLVSVGGGQRLKPAAPIADTPPTT